MDEPGEREREQDMNYNIMIKQSDSPPQGFNKANNPLANQPIKRMYCRHRRKYGEKMNGRQDR